MIILPGIMFLLSSSPPWYLPANFPAFPEPWTSQLASHSLQTHRLDRHIHVALNASDSGILSNALFPHCGCFGTVTSCWDFVGLCPQSNSWTSHSGTYRNFPKNKTSGKDLGSFVGAGHVHLHLFTSFSVSALCQRALILCLFSSPPYSFSQSCSFMQ